MSRTSTTVAVLTALAVVGGVGMMALAFATARIGPAAIPIWMFAMGGATLIFRGPLGKAIAKSIAGDDTGAMPPELPAEILGELDDLRHRVLELEERVDFSERLLANKGQPLSGGPPHG